MKEFLKNSGITLGLLCAALVIAALLYQNSSGQADLSMVFFPAVIFIAQKTKGYHYGIAACIISVFCVNYFFTEPFFQLNFSNKGYPIMFLGMLGCSVIISTLTTKIMRQTETSILREQNTRILFQENLRLERERDKIKMEAEQEASRNILLRAVSHDLRTPLTAIGGASSALLDNWNQLEDSQKKKLIKDIQTDSQWLTRMVENLLSVTRVQDGVATLKKKPEVAEELAADAIQKIKQRFTNVTVSLSLPDQFLMIPMDSMLIEQVLINLMENSIRHSGKPDRIGLTIRKENDDAVFEVEDWGTGIPMNSIPFKTETLTGDAVRNPGLGLKVCKTIVQAHGGQISAHNKPNGGAVFSFTLPVQEDIL